MPEALKLGFAGTPEFAATLLDGLLGAGYHLELVLTQPDRPSGRGRKLAPSAVKSRALAAGLTVRCPVSLKDFDLAAFGLDLLIVAAYGLILKPDILRAPRLGCLNVHASLLPRWRGAAPVERAMMAGDTTTGVCLMAMDEGLDTGPVYRCAETAIGSTETGGALEARLAELGKALLLETLPKLETLTPVPQPDVGATYAAKLTAADRIVNWTDQADAIARHINALADRLPVTVYGRDDHGPARITLLAAAATDDAPMAEPGTITGITKAGLIVACGAGTVSINSLKLDRGKGSAMNAKAAANGYSGLIHSGAMLSPEPVGTSQ